MIFLVSDKALIPREAALKIV